MPFVISQRPSPDTARLPLLSPSLFFLAPVSRIPFDFLASYSLTTRLPTSRLLLSGELASCFCYSAAAISMTYDDHDDILSQPQGDRDRRA